jgi:thiosulfate/3-mercaptopyruvate sulfurtransferase
MTITLVSPDYVQLHIMSDPRYLFLDARPAACYLAGHLPGAIWVGWESWCEAAPVPSDHPLAQAGYWGILNKEDETGFLQNALEQIGVSNDRPVLVYADGPLSKGREGRIAWMLLYWGLSDVYLLDGGWTAWLKQGGSGDTSTALPLHGQFHIHAQEHRRVYLRQLKQDFQRQSMPLLVDTRSRAEFLGLGNTYQPRMGRLPQAIHLPNTELFENTGYFVTKEVYLQRLPEKIRSAEYCVAYCEVGVRSCLFALLHEVYTGQIVSNYDGSIMEWALEWSLPMERGDA